MKVEKIVNFYCEGLKNFFIDWLRGFFNQMFWEDDTLYFYLFTVY